MISISLFYCCKKVFILMNIWMIGKYFNETLLPEKENFYIHLNMEDIFYIHLNMYIKRICNEFEIKNFREYHDVHVQSDSRCI